jgi:hypothetical protein
MSLEDRERKRCRACQLDWPLWCFARHRGTCRMCQQTFRDEKKALDRFPTKVQWSRQSHARRLHRPAAELRQVYGWTDERMMHDVRQAWWTGCLTCGRPVVATQRNGLSNLIRRGTAPTRGGRVPSVLEREPLAGDGRRREVLVNHWDGGDTECSRGCGPRTGRALGKRSCNVCFYRQRCAGARSDEKNLGVAVAGG